MDLVAYTAGQRVFMLAIWGFGAWVLPMTIALPGYGRARVDLDEYASAYASATWFGWEPEGSAAVVMRLVLLACGVMMAVPELLGL